MIVYRQAISLVDQLPLIWIFTCTHQAGGCSDDYVTPDGGLTPLLSLIVDEKPGMASHFNLENVYRPLDGFCYNPQNPMQVGQGVALDDVAVEVTEMTSDGRIAQATFTFGHSLDDNRYVWLLWDEATSAYASVQMPPVGETSVYP